MIMKHALQQDWEAFWLSHYKDIDVTSAFNLESHQGKVTFELLKKRSRNEKILEAGCGIGNWAFLFERLGFSAYGIDISFSSLRKAISCTNVTCPSAKFLQGDIKVLPFKDKAFDVVVSYGAIEHFPDTSCALDDFYRVLRPGGGVSGDYPQSVFFS